MTNTARAVGWLRYDCAGQIVCRLLSHALPSREESGGFHSRAVRVERLLPCRAFGATRVVRKDVRVRLQHLLLGSSVQHMGHEDIGDGEVLGRDELALSLIHISEPTRL